MPMGGGTVGITGEVLSSMNVPAFRQVSSQVGRGSAFAGPTAGGRAVELKAIAVMMTNALRNDVMLILLIGSECKFSFLLRGSATSD